jgi:diacylglycerol kinase family enzyme
MQLNVVWKALIFIALLLYAGIAFVLITLLAHNVAFAVILSLTATFLVYAVWLLVTGVNKRRRYGLWLSTVGIALLSVEIGYFLTDQKNRRALVLVVGLAGIYIVLATQLRNRYWHDMRNTAQNSQTTALFQHPYLIMNPKSGDGRAVKAHIPELAAASGIQVLVLNANNTIEGLAEQAIDKGADVLGVSGGDGTIGAVAKVAMEHQVPIVVLPGGTRCHFARDLGMDPKKITDAMAGFTGIERRIDVGEINGRIFLNNASFGLYADIVDQPGYREHKREVSRNIMSKLVSGDKKPYDLYLDHEEQHIQKAVQILVGVNRYNTVNLFELGRRDQLDGGMLQTTILTELNDKTARKLLGSISMNTLGHHTDLEKFYQWESQELRISSPDEMLVTGVDGEREVYKNPVLLRILPGALKVFVPAEGARSRPANVLSMDYVRRMLHVAS